jgi:hypothetical protein
MSLKRRFERFRAPGEDGARDRSWHVVRDVFEESGSERAPVRRRARLRPATAVAAATAGLALLASLTGPAVADWIHDVVDRDGGEAGPPPLRLPAEGRLLVNTPSGPWIVNRDGSMRLLGEYGDASWSPQALFLTASRGSDLFALEPGGRVRWQVPAPRAVRSPRWAPSGFRIAYLSGSAVRVVAGDGTADRLLAPRAAAAAPAWHPMREHVLAYADEHGQVTVVHADSGRTLWRSAPGPPVVELAWSADGARLVAVSDGSLRILNGRGQPLRTLQMEPLGPMRGSISVVAFARKGHTFALIRRRAAAHEVVLLHAERGAHPPRRLFAGPGRIGGTAWSPDGRWLLIQWDGSTQWLFVSIGRDRPVRTADRIPERFDAGADRGPELPGRTEWCC